MDKAKESFLKAFDFIKEKWGALSKTARVVTLSVIAAVIIAIIVLVLISNRTIYETLYTGMSNKETNEVTAALAEIGITNISVAGDTVKVPADVVNVARMELAVKGYPKTGISFDILDNVGMFSTESEKKSKEVQQLTVNLMSSLNSIPEVESSSVIITPPENEPFMISSTDKPSQAMVMLTLKNGVKLTSAQIEGIRRIVLTSVPQLTEENLGLTDGRGIPLTAEDGSSAENALALDMKKRDSYLEFRRNMEALLEGDLSEFLTGVVRDFRIQVSADIDFVTGRTTQETIYTGSNVDEDGRQTGIVENQEDSIAYNGFTPEGGIVGTTIDADISPDYPTLIAEGDTEVYYERIRDLNYKVNEYITQYESDGFEVKSISVGVILDEATLSQQEIDDWTRLLANAANTTTDLVSVMTKSFPLTGGPELGEGGTVSQGNRNLLIFIIIALGALLIILFFLAILTSGSKKKRIIRARAAAMQNAAAMSPPGYAADGGLGLGNVHGKPEINENDFQIQSLLSTEGGETREALLKNEIREFAKSNPDIVAQLIRTWMREP